MKVRITKVPDKKNESLNARKWNHADGGFIDEDPNIEELEPSIVRAYEPLYVDTPYNENDFFARWYPNREKQMAYNMAVTSASHGLWPFGHQRRAEKNAEGYIASVLANNSNVKEFAVPYFQGKTGRFKNAFKDEGARKVLSDHLENKFRWAGKEIPEGGFSDQDIALYELGTSYGKSYKDNPYYIFYDRTNPSQSTVVHERTHTLLPLPEDVKSGGKYSKYQFFGNPMERMADTIKTSLLDVNVFRPLIGKPESYPERIYSEKMNKMRKEDSSSFSYYSSAEEIVARLNEIRFRQGINPKHEVTVEDLQEIRKNATKDEKEGFLDLYTDDALIQFFNLIASSNDQESLYGNHLGNIVAYGGKLRKLMTRL